MKTNGSIILYHFDEESQEEIPTEYLNVSISGNVRIGDLSHGRRKQNSFTVRIPTDSEVNVSCGDRVVNLSDGRNFTVVGFADNRRGSAFSRHFKILLK